MVASLRWILLTFLLGTPAHALSDRAEVDAFCEYLDNSHETLAMQYLTPSLFSTYTRAAVATDNGALNNVGRLRVGAEYNIISLGKYSVLKGMRAAQCDQARAQSIYDVASEKDEVDARLAILEAKTRGLEQKRLILTKGLEPLEKSTQIFRQRFKNGSATVRDIEAVMSGVTLVRTSLLDATFELEQTQRELATVQEKHAAIQSILRRISGPAATQAARQQLHDSLLRVANLEQQKEWLDGFSLNVAAAYQALDNPAFTNQPGSAFIGLEMRINLGTVASSFGSSETLRYSDWLKRRSLREARAHIFVSVADQVRHLNEKLTALEDHEQALRDVMRVAQFNEQTILSMPAAARSFSLYVLADANADQVRTELASLRGPTPAPAKPMEFAAIDAQAEADLDPQMPAEPTSRAPQATRTDRANFRRDQNATTPYRATARFSLVEKMQNVRKLGSGETRHQMGLMLLRKNQCNMLYVMLRLGKTASIAVQEKINPGKSTHQECNNDGYRAVAGTALEEVGEILPGEKHTLSAEATASSIQVWLDGRLVWKSNGVGTSQTGATIGFRSDNVVVDYELSDRLENAP